MMKYYVKEMAFMILCIATIIAYFIFVALVIDPKCDKLSDQELQSQQQSETQAHTQAKTETITQEPTTENTTESQTKRQVTTEEYNLLLRVCMSECGGKYGEALEGKIAVVETILNRVDLGYGTIKEVVFAKGQYSMADNGEPDYTVVEAVEMALSGNMYPDDMIYFRTKHYHTFGTPYMKIGNHFFSLEG